MATGATLKMKSVSIHVGEYSDRPGFMPGVHRVILGVDDAGQVWEHTQRGWVPLSMDVAKE